jgi:hypothetical protein
MSERRSSGHHPVAQDRLPRVVCHFTLHGRKRAVRIGLALGCSKYERMPFQRPLQFRNQGDSANPGLQSTCRENVVICRETNLHWLFIWGEAMDQKTETKFELVGKDAHATAEFRNDLFVVLAGSVARGTSVPSAPPNLSVRRGKLISEGVLEETPEGLRFTRDCDFDSPSGAAMLVMGRSANGWIEWRTTDGQKLSEVRKVQRDETKSVLTDELRQKIINHHAAMVQAGKLPTQQQLQQQYDLFRSRFGPQVLRGLDGEQLLSLMHDLSNLDSLVYWLEFNGPVACKGGFRRQLAAR